MAKKKISAYEAQKAAEETVRLAALKITLDARAAAAALVRTEGLRLHEERCAAARAAALVAGPRIATADDLARDEYEARMTAAARTYRETDTGADPLAHTEGREGE